jgi:hypothetical protein
MDGICGSAMGLTPCWRGQRPPEGFVVEELDGLRTNLVAVVRNKPSASMSKPVPGCPSVGGRDALRASFLVGSCT